VDELIPLLAVLLIFGTPLGVVWLGLRHRAQKALASRGSAKELDVIRDEAAVLQHRLARWESVEEQITNLTLQLDDVARRPLPDDAAPES